MAHYRNLSVVAAEIVEQCSQMVAHESSGKFMVSHKTTGCDR